jgi:hypothetical protein
VEWSFRNSEALPRVLQHEMGIVGQEPGGGSRGQQGERQSAYRSQGAPAGGPAAPPNPNEYEALSTNGSGRRQSAEGLVLTPRAVGSLQVVHVASAPASFPGGPTAAPVQCAAERQEDHAGDGRKRQKHAQRGPPAHGRTIASPFTGSWRRRLMLCNLGNWAKGTFPQPARSFP